MCGPWAVVVMYSQERSLKRSTRDVWLVLATTSCFLLFGLMLGRPRGQHYLLEILLIAVGVCLALLAAASLYVVVKPAKRGESPQSVVYACAIALFLLALFFVGKWIAIA